MELLEFLIKKRRAIILGTLLTGIIGAIFSLVTPKKYEATSCIMPSLDMMGTGFGSISGNSAAMSMLQLLGGIAATPADIYAELATNKIVIERLIKEFSLDTVYKAKYFDDLIETVRGHIKTTATVSGFVYISYRDKNPIRAATLCNAITTQLDRLNREIIVTKGKKLRIFLGERLKETEDSLRLYQDSLALYQKKYGLLDLETSIKSIVANWEEIEKNFVNLKLQYEFALAEAGPGSKTTINLKKRLDVIEREKNRLWNVTFDSIAHLPAIKNIPEIGKNYARIKLMLEKYIQTYKLLAAEYEKAKIMEKQNTPTLQIIYKASVPERRYWPKRKLIVLLFMIVFFFTYTTYLAIVYIINRSPQGHKTLSMIKEALLHPLGKE